MGLRFGIQGFRGNGHLKQKWNATTLRVLVAMTNIVVALQLNAGIVIGDRGHLKRFEWR